MAGVCRCTRLLGSQRRLPDLLLHQPAERPADVLPRPRLGHHPPERVRGRGRRLPDHRPDRAERWSASGTIPAGQIPLIIQDRTFVPDAAQLAAQDPTWDAARWGGYGNLWYHHVYMPAQNPGDPGGMSAYGRWMYGPWFWPPATPPHGPIANPYYDPQLQPGRSLPPGSTRPTRSASRSRSRARRTSRSGWSSSTTRRSSTGRPTRPRRWSPKTYRFRILNAANDRFWNLQWYVADPSTGTDSEVALNPAELAAAQTRPGRLPDPGHQPGALPGPSWIQIGTEGGFLPAPVVVPNQPITWITDPTRFDVGNVDSTRCCWRRPSGPT